MNRVRDKIRIGAALFLLLLAVVYVFAMPTIDLDPTALRATRHAALVFIGIASAARTLTPQKPEYEGSLVELATLAPRSSDLVDLTSIRLC